MTIADREAETAVLEVIRRHRPGDAILSEEAGAAAGRRGDAAGWWTPSTAR